MLYIPFPFKRCTKCRQYLSPTKSNFLANQHTKDRLDSWCRNCHLKNTREWRQANKEHVRKYNHDYRVTHIDEALERERRYRRDFPDRVHASEKKWRLANPAKKRESRRHWYHANPEKVRAQRKRTYTRHKATNLERGRQWQRSNSQKVYQIVKRYRQAHPLKAREFVQARRTRRFGLPFLFSATAWRTCLDYWRGCCAYCGNQQGLFPATKLSADHFVPLSSPDCPGTITTNMLPACQGCNSSKSDSDPIEWLIKRFGKRKAKHVLKNVQDYFKWVENQPG